MDEEPEDDYIELDEDLIEEINQITKPVESYIPPSRKNGTTLIRNDIDPDWDQ